MQCLTEAMALLLMRGTEPRQEFEPGAPACPIIWSSKAFSKNVKRGQVTWPSTRRLTTMDDIVERLKAEAVMQREIASEWAGEKRDHHIENAARAEDAASEIERLRSALEGERAVQDVMGNALSSVERRSLATASPADTYRTVVEFVRCGQPISAIREVHASFPVSLLEAKRLVEAVMESVVPSSALAAEREECAKVAEQIEWVEVEFPIEGVTRPNEPTRKSIAAAIRNRK
jgi:ribosomal protein L7/L12